MTPKILVVRTYQVHWHKSPTYTATKICNTLEEAQSWMGESWGESPDGRPLPDQFTVAEVVDWEAYKKYRGYEQQAMGHA